MAAASASIDCAPLAATSATTTVRVRDGEVLLTDGPAAELKEQVGGYEERMVPSTDDDELALIFLCCHPALESAVRVALTLRSVCGLTTREIAAAFIVPEPTMAKRLTNGKQEASMTDLLIRDVPERLSQQSMGKRADSASREVSTCVAPSSVSG